MPIAINDRRETSRSIWSETSPDCRVVSRFSIIHGMISPPPTNKTMEAMVMTRTRE
jgi:hypothetical protein